MPNIIPVEKSWPQRRAAAVQILGGKFDLPDVYNTFLGHAQINGLDFAYFEDDQGLLFPTNDTQREDLLYEVCFLNIPKGFQNVRYLNDPWSGATVQLAIDPIPTPHPLHLPFLANLYWGTTQTSTRGAAPPPPPMDGPMRFVAGGQHFCQAGTGFARAGKFLCGQQVMYGGTSSRIKLFYAEKGVFLNNTLYQYFMPLRLPNQMTLYYLINADKVQATLKEWYNRLLNCSPTDIFFVAVDDIYGVDPLEITATTKAEIILSAAS